MPNPPISIVPQSGQTLAQTLLPIQQNFNTINLDFAVDHVGYGASADEGKHNQVTFPIHLGSIAPLTTEIVLFNQNNSLTGISDIWMQRGTPPASGSNPIPITGSLQNPSLTNGWSYLPSGILIKWGRINGTFPNGVWQQFLYPVAANIPLFNNVFNVSIQAISQDTPPGSTAQTFNYITVASGAGSTSSFNLGYFWWIPRTNFSSVNQMSLFYYAIGN